MPRPKGAQLKQVVAEIANDERLAICQYMRIRDDVDKSAWKQIHHAAKFLKRVYTINTVFKDGLFFGSDLTQDEIEMRLWMVFLRLSDHANSKHRARQPGASTVTTDVGDDEEEDDADNDSEDNPGPIVSEFGGRVLVQSRETEFTEEELIMTRINKLNFAQLQERIVSFFNLSGEEALFRIESTTGLPNGETEINADNWDQYIQVLLGMKGEDYLWFETVPKTLGDSIGHSAVTEDRIEHPSYIMSRERIFPIWRN